MKKSVFVRLLSTYSLLIVGLGLFILLFSFRTVRSYYLDILADHLERLAITGSLIIGQAGSAAQADSLVNELGRQLKVRMTVIDPAGRVLADSEEDPAGMENHATRPEIISALEGRRGVVLRYSTTVRKEMLYVALKRQTLPGGGTGVIRISVFTSAITALLGSIRGSILVSTVVVIVLALGIALMAARSISRPIRKLTNASRKIAAGDFSAKVFLDRPDELKELADSFNTMSDDLQQLVRELSRQKEELNSIIASIREGLLVLDSDGKILLCNTALLSVFGAGEAVGRRYWELSREEGFTAFVEEVRDRQSGMTGQMTLDGRHYRISATYIPERGDVIMLFHDVTEMKQLETVKRDFVINVSHELRTPLTAIKGFAETLAEELDGDQQRYVEIINRHTWRLIHIVEDLLRLSELEEGRLDDLAETDLGGLLRSVSRVLEIRIKEKGLTLTLDLPDKGPMVTADAFRLEQVFINLIDNAVKYTETGGITIRAEDEADMVAVSVSDTGIGIPPAGRDRIFERFYVVDKSRSRQSGGTGLGLSIVKHIVGLHHGSINVRSTPGQGTAFTVRFPRVQPA